VKAHKAQSGDAASEWARTCPREKRRPMPRSLGSLESPVPGRIWSRDHEGADRRESPCVDQEGRRPKPTPFPKQRVGPAAPLPGRTAGAALLQVPTYGVIV
jgi:hypothetical protein